MWQALQEICQREGTTVHAICTELDEVRDQSTLTGAVRVFILDYFQEAAHEAEGLARRLRPGRMRPAEATVMN